MALVHDGETGLVDLSYAHHWSVPQGEAIHSGTVLQGEAIHSGTVPQGEALQRGDGDEVPATCGCGLVERSARPGLEWTPLNTRYSP